MRPAAYWLPPVVWMAVILFFSFDTGSAEQTGPFLLPLLRWLLPWATPAQLGAIHGLLRKGGHLTEYAILVALWFRAFAGGRWLGGRAAAWGAFAMALAWACLDELLQSLQASRTGSAMDVAIDGAGAVAALAAVRLGWRATVELGMAVLLWIAAVGGAAVLAVNALTGVASGMLWLTAPAAALGLIARRLLRR
ncbi:MAG: VanZ family protein [Candidatus Rokubacteria bacterium]|nr:VanZ family protein [Candidatus Rokubacteria bacterium]